MCGVPEAKIGHSQLCFVIIHNVIIITGAIVATMQ